MTGQAPTGAAWVGPPGLASAGFAADGTPLLAGPDGVIPMTYLGPCTCPHVLAVAGEESAPVSTGEATVEAP